MLFVTRIIAVATIAVALLLPAIAVPLPRPVGPERTHSGPSHAFHPYTPPAPHAPPHTQERNRDLKRGSTHTHAPDPHAPLQHVKTDAHGDHLQSTHHVPGHNLIMGVAHAHTLNEASTGHEGGILHRDAMDEHVHAIKNGVKQHLANQGDDSRHHVDVHHQPNRFQTQHAHFVSAPHPEGHPPPNVRHFIVGPDTRYGRIDKNYQTKVHHGLIGEAHKDHPPTVHHIAPVPGLHGEAAIGTMQIHRNMMDMDGLKGFDHLHAHAHWIRDNFFPGWNADVHVAHVAGTDKVHFFASTRPGGTLTPQLTRPAKKDLVKELEAHQKSGHIPRSHAMNNDGMKNHEAYGGTIPALQLTGNTVSHMEAYAEFAGNKIANEHRLTKDQKNQLVVSAQHFDNHPDVHYRTQPRGAHGDLKTSGETAKAHFPGIASTAMQNHGVVTGYSHLPLIHSEIAGAMEMVGAAGLTHGDMQQNMPGHVIGIHQSGDGWDRPCPHCHQVLGGHTSADYKGRDALLKDESQRVVP